MDRIYHPYTVWEEVEFGLWIKPRSTDDHIEMVLEVMRDHIVWGEYMQKVCQAWVHSCEHNLSNITINRVAWLGQAACCYATGAPAVITKEAWWLLSKEEQANANDQAKSAIEEWEKCQR